MKRSIPVLLALTIGCATGAAVRDIVVLPVRRGKRGQATNTTLFNWSKAQMCLDGRRCCRNMDAKAGA
jgi:hypothetical protein